MNITKRQGSLASPLKPSVKLSLVVAIYIYKNLFHSKFLYETSGTAERWMLIMSKLRILQPTCGESVAVECCILPTYILFHHNNNIITSPSYSIQKEISFILHLLQRMLKHRSKKILILVLILILMQTY